MKNFYKIFKGLIPITPEDKSNKNIASAPNNSYGIIIGNDGTKIDFFGGHSIESSQTNPLIRNGNVFVSSGDVKYDYFPINGFSEGDSLEDSIFHFLKNENVPNDIGNRKQIKYISTNIKFKDLTLSGSLNVNRDIHLSKTATIGNLLLSEIKKFLKVNGTTTLKDKLTVDGETQITGNSKVTGIFETTGETTIGGALQVNNTANITGATQIGTTEAPMTLNITEKITTGELSTESSDPNLPAFSTNTLDAAEFITKETTNDKITIEVNSLTDAASLDIYKETNLEGPTTFNGKTDTVSLSVTGTTELNTLTMTSTADNGALFKGALSTESISFSDAIDDGLTPSVSINDENGDTTIDGTITAHTLKIEGKDPETDYYLYTKGENNKVEIAGDNGNLEVSELLKSNDTITSNGTLITTDTTLFKNKMTIEKNGLTVNGDSNLNNNLINGKLEVTNDISTLVGNVTIKNGLEVPSADITSLTGNVELNTILNVNNISVLEKKATVNTGDVEITGTVNIKNNGGLSASSFSTEYGVTVTDETSTNSIIKYNDTDPSLTSGSMSSKSLILNGSLETTEETGTSKIGDNINITGNLTVTGDININNTTISIPDIVGPTIESLNIATTAPTPTSPNINITTLNEPPIQSGYTGDNNDWTNGVIEIDAAVKKDFNTVNVNETLIVKNLIEKDINSVNSGSILNTPVDTSSERISIENLELDNWTDNTNFISDKSSLEFKNDNDANKSTLLWSSTGYQLCAKVLDETRASSISEYIGFAKKGSNGYEFIESNDINGCKIDMDSDTTEIYLNGEFTEIG